MAIGPRTGTAPDGPDTYDIARAAAEDGNFDLAIASYEQVLQAYPRGKTGAEVRLEFANILLYANQPDRAAEVAGSVRKLSRDKELRGRAAILGAIARHIEIETYLSRNPPYLQARDKARGVYLAMEKIYDRHGKYDDGGIIPTRIRILRESLATLELRQMRSEIAQGSRNVAAQRARYILTEFGDTEVVSTQDNLLRSTAA